MSTSIDFDCLSDAVRPTVADFTCAPDVSTLSGNHARSEPLGRGSADGSAATAVASSKARRAARS